MSQSSGTDIIKSLKVDHRSEIPVYRQIIDQIKELIYCAKLQKMDKLPPVRTLAQALDINPNTVARAYRDLEQEGILQSRVGRGTFFSGKAENTNKDVKKKQLASFRREILQKCAAMGLTEQDMAKLLLQHK